MEIGKKLKNKRLELNLTQEDISRKLLVSRKSISNWETGKNLPDIENMLKLCSLFDLNLNKLLEEDLTIMNKLKTYERAYKLKWWRFLTAQVIGISLIALLATGEFFKLSLFSKAIILIIFLSSGALNIFFIKEIKKIPPKLQGGNQVRSQLIFASGSLILSIVCLVVGLNSINDFFYKIMCLSFSFILFILFVLFLWGIKYAKKSSY